MKRTLSQITEGSLVNLNEGGYPAEFYVADHDYNPGRTLLVRKEVYDYLQWDADDINVYKNSDIDIWLNGPYKSFLDAEIQEAIGLTSLSSGLQRAVFLLDYDELGLVIAGYPSTNNVLPIANILRIAYKNNVATTQWTRHPSPNHSFAACYITSDGTATTAGVSTKLGVRPVLTLPADIKVDISEFIHGQSIAYSSVGGTIVNPNIYVGINGVVRQADAYLSINGVIKS